MQTELLSYSIQLILSISLRRMIHFDIKDRLDKKNHFACSFPARTAEERIYIYISIYRILN